MSYILGVDLSLTATGVAMVDAAARTFKTGLIRTDKLTGLERIEAITKRLAALAADAWYVAIEGPSYGSASGQAGHHERAGLWWIAYRELSGWCKVAVVPPASLKLYASGKGNTAKDGMILATARRFKDFDGENNQADALWLACAAADHHGMPLVDLPAVNRAALAKVTWPVLS